MVVACAVLAAACVDDGSSVKTAGGSTATAPPTVAPQPPMGSAREEVAQHGITFSFDRAYVTGRFVNGDWWVVADEPGGAVVLVSMTPAYDEASATDGWMVNPNSMRANSYDGRRNATGRFAVAGWDPQLLPELPLRLLGDSSVVKVVSASDPGGSEESGHAPALQTAAVLTVLDKAPPRDSFRPPYFGLKKRLFTLNDVQLEKLPALPPPPETELPTLDWVAGRFSRVQLDHYSGWLGRYMHPADNFRPEPGVGAIANYGAAMARDHNSAILRLMVAAEPVRDKQEALIAVLQAGIDWYGIADAGGTWPPDGGHMVGRKQMVVFASVLFDDDAMKRIAGAPRWDLFSENGHVYSADGRALFGRPEDADGDYWKRLDRRVGRRDLRDPLGAIDGGTKPGGAYQSLVSGTYSEAALIARLLPRGEEVWNDPAFIQYVDRWREDGAWTQPDPAAERRPAFGALHGERGREAYRTDFQAAMWDLYR